MRRSIILLAFLTALPAVLPASEFDWMVREFSRQTGSQQLHIPFFGLVRFAVHVVQPAGASDLKLAVFENAPMGSSDFSSLTDRTVGNDWKPIVRVRQRSGEVSNIYVQPDGKHLRVLIATLANSREAVFVQVRIRPEELIKFVDEQQHNHHA